MTVPLLIEALTTLKNAYGLAAVAAEAVDEDLLDEAASMTEDGNGLTGLANEALGTSC